MNGNFSRISPIYQVIKHDTMSQKRGEPTGILFVTVEQSRGVIMGTGGTGKNYMLKAELEGYDVVH